MGRESKAVNRVLVSKNIRSGVTTESRLSNGIPVHTIVTNRYKDRAETDLSIPCMTGLPESVQSSIDWNEETFSPVSDISGLGLDDSETKPTLSSVYSDSSVRDEVIGSKELLAEAGALMFSKINPKTHIKDVDESAFYAPYVTQVILTSALPPQVSSDGKDVFFNPDGTISVAEFLDCLNSISKGYNSKDGRHTSLDGISDETDYFNEGYNSCVKSVSSPFYRLYTRDELTKPMLRSEMAFIVLFCWTPFESHFGSIWGGDKQIGLNTSWLRPNEELLRYTDGDKYKVSEKVSDDEYGSLELNIKGYLGDMNMTSFKNSLLSGSKPIPLPMLMSTVELDKLGVLHCEGSELAPLRQVSRGEVAYLLCNLAEILYK